MKYNIEQLLLLPNSFALFVAHGSAVFKPSPQT